jgi:hypothetical protein
MFGWFVLKQHSHRGSIVIIELTAPDAPEKGEQETDSEEQAEDDQEKDYTHFTGTKLFFRRSLRSDFSQLKR